MENFLNRLYGFDASKIENRKYLRFPLSLDAECHYTTGGKAQKCRLVDVSEQGAGFELDTHADISYGQNVLLAINLPDRKAPVSAIAKLQWSKPPRKGALRQRVGGRLIFIAPKEKAMLLQHAYAMVLVNATKNSFALRAMSIRFPKFS